MSSPFFTIGIPTFNRAEYLRGAIAAALRQSEPDFELLILDNASDDSTPKVVAAFHDARIRYIRQDSNVGPLRNFQDLAGHARGAYLILHQDDDLIHHQFLERCRAAVSRHGVPVMYAAPMWMGAEGQSCGAKLLPPPSSDAQSYMITDEVLVFEGAEIATRFLVSIPFNFPAIALHTETFRASGGFYMEFAYGGDIVTLSRLATLGRVFYDPRIGGFYRLHGANASVGLEKGRRIRWHELKLHRMVGFLDARKIPWEEILWNQLRSFSSNELVHEFGLLTRYRAPKRLQACVYRAILASWKRSRFRLVRRLLHRVGFRNLVRYGWNQAFGKDLGAGATLESIEKVARL